MARERSGVAVGFTYFAAVMLMIIGLFDVLEGVSAIIKKNYYVVGNQYLWKLDVTAWGWIHTILGVVLVVAGIALLFGMLWARIVGVIAAALAAIGNFMWLPYSPIWATVIIAACVTVIWALTMHADDISDDKLV